MKIITKHFAGGKYVEAFSKELYTSLNPANNEPLATSSVGNQTDIDRAVRAARQAFDDGPWPRLSRKERTEILRRFSEGIQKSA
ncbi:MAG: aldehyde dehydrogenase family protein, partial [Deltaproteobacteria bacterium]|nr:aldehyde dehydrogenase family protein [Deltaproteobacteria bacterium]